MGCVGSQLRPERSCEKHAGRPNTTHGGSKGTGQEKARGPPRHLNPWGPKNQTKRPEAAGKLQCRESEEPQESSGGFSSVKYFSHLGPVPLLTCQGHQQLLSVACPSPRRATATSGQRDTATSAQPRSQPPLLPESNRLEQAEPALPRGLLYPKRGCLVPLVVSERGELRSPSESEARPRPARGQRRNLTLCTLKIYF